MYIEPSYCLCTKDNKVSFKNVIVYRNETIFKKYEGVVIKKCERCGLLKTFPPAWGVFFNPTQSRSDLYENNSVEFAHLFKPIVEQIKNYSKGQSVLEVGCSTGILLSLLQKEGFTVQGIEPNKKAAFIAQQKIGKFIYNGTLPSFSKKNKRTFDCVVYNHVLEHIMDVRHELFVIKKILNPNGVFIIGVPNTNNVVFSIRKKYWESLMPNEHVWHFSTGYLISLFKEYGLVTISTSFTNHKRADYPILKKVYFGTLTLLNKILGTGEALLLVSIKKTY